MIDENIKEHLDYNYEFVEANGSDSVTARYCQMLWIAV